jgi:hypothetical protein
MFLYFNKSYRLINYSFRKVLIKRVVVPVTRLILYLSSYNKAQISNIYP